MIYHIPQLSNIDLSFFRVGGPGLGNLMFPISRALIAAQTMGGTFVYPTVPQLKIGPVLRREKDKRFYFQEMKSKGFADHINTARSLLRPKFDESQVLENSDIKNASITYSGLKRYFIDLNGHEDLIRSFFHEHSLYPLPTENTDIRLHIRQGDFKPAHALQHQTEHSVQTSLCWYRKCLEQIFRDNTFTYPKIVVHTDGDRQKITECLDGIDFVFDESPSALASILNLSNAQHLVCSRSTFSLWGAFLSKGKVYIPDSFDTTTTIILAQERIVKIHETLD